jgi:hypothetical protein
VCIATYFALHNTGQELEPEATLNEARGGLAPSEVIEVAVKPAGLPVSSTIVITETPEACNLKLALSASVESVITSKFVIALFLIRGLVKGTAWSAHLYNYTDS